MRIALLTSATIVSGVAVHCLLLMKYLAGRGHAVLLVHRPDAWIAAQPGLEGVERLVTSFARRPGELARVARAIADFRAEVIHTHASSAHSYGAAARLFGTLPVVATAHVPHFQLHWPLNHLVLATSQETADFNRRYNRVAARKLRVIPNFVDTGRIRPATAVERAAARIELGLSDQNFVVGSVGNLARYKRPADLVRAFAPLAAARSEARLVMIGRDLDAAVETRTAISALGLEKRVLLTGAREDRVDLLAAMDVFALASRRESGPLAILEAMARGLPVVATRTGMVPEFVRDNETGALVDVGDTCAMAAHFIALAEDPARRVALGRAARAHVERNYSVDEVAPRIEAALAEAARIRNRPPLGFLARLAAGNPVSPGGRSGSDPIRPS